LIVGAVFLKERLSLLRIASAFLIFSGAVLIAS
jgi:drug/metabolite transporter (DMT)-like permease